MVRYGSVTTRFMISRLRDSIVKVLNRNNYRYENVDVVGGSRVIVSGLNSSVAEEVADKLAKIFGVSSTSPAIMVDYDLSVIIDALLEMIAHDRPKSIRLKVMGGPGYNRLFLEKLLASIIINEAKTYIDLRSPDKEYIIDIRQGKTFIINKIYRGVGGLPYGVEGCLVVLLSGGVDSSLAAWYALKRGTRIIPVFIDLGKYWSEQARKRFYESISLIYEWVPWDKIKFYIVRGAEKIVESANIPARLRCLLCKANMYRIASIIADKEKCLGIVTGEAVGQVASQTLRNLYILSRLSPKPVYRPVAFMDKLEIIEQARKLGFHILSRDVGTCLLKPPHPETSASEKDYYILKKVLQDTMDTAVKLVEQANIKYYPT
ncbi:tRNA sulfurtransferase [Staphylothermus hellenicus]|uniref:Thiamine biosynthesis protein-like protein n=1 Tax=Staphylothermus hellenicus (strain DSM 12710 / JCM 10830 / BK20S6-10-b1 / P8) TaxID=591019 RepID=D7DBE3_STAHD|nr:THUMP domain-containing protein [Staphylothermus hellenicus]ADI31490.1 Thiamine biosynthesis protein-like protein [Staphylothermus hellenicus DSM 12710]